MTDLFDTRRRMLLGSAAAAALALGSASPALAQDQSQPTAEQEESDTAQDEGPSPAAAPQIGTETDTGSEIVVTGFRASLANAVAEKKTSDQVVESISAEDIGKLPDASIAESIARLPGLTSQRLSGRSNNISIRGFSPDFSTTLLNGREQTTTGENRAVEYDQYPSEIISQVNVYKTPMASLVGQGLSGTVDLRTIRPLKFGREVFSIGARGSYADLGKLNAGSDDKGFRVSATYVDQYAGDTVGLAVSVSYTDEPYQLQEFNAWGYPGVNANAVVIGGAKPYATSTQLQRLGLQGTLEFQMHENFTSTLDLFYSDFKDDQIRRGIEIPLFWSGAQLQPGFNVTDGVVTSGTFTGVEAVVRNDVFQRHAKLFSAGWNSRYEGDSGFNAMLDLSYSRTDRNELVLESYSGTGRGGGVGATDTIAFQSGPRGTVFNPTLNYGDYNLIKLTSPLGWGGDQTAVNGTRIVGGQDGYYNDRIIDDELYQFRAEAEQELEGFLRSVQAGVNYTSRTKSLTPDEAFLGLVANTNGTTDVVIPEQFRQGTTNLKFLGLGPMVSYNPLDLLEAGIYQRVPNPYGDVVVKAYNVDERQWIGYLQGNIEHELGLGRLTGNFGVQAIHTDQSSQGASAVYLGQNPNGSPNIGGIPREEGASYWDILPSLNLSLRTGGDLVVRLAAARQIIRPRLEDMRASLSYGTEIRSNGPGTTPFAFISGGSGNPQLRPWRANAVDFTIEKYWGREGFVALQLFYKDLKSYIYNATVDFDFTGFPVGNPGTYTDAAGVVRPIPIQTLGQITAPINGEGGSLYGVELAATLPFSAFSAALDGFGITGGASYTKTSISPTPGAPAEDIPGYSKWVANGTAFFEKWGFSARASVRHRSTFVGEVSGFGAARQRRRAAPETIVDAQIGYDFQPGSAFEGLSVFLQGQNLTDEPFVTFNPGAPLQVIDYQRYGRRFLAGFNFKF
jgi:iron complex outermembrane receptor protein